MQITERELNQIKYYAVLEAIGAVSEMLAEKHGIAKTSAALEIIDHKIDVILAVKSYANTFIVKGEL